jgi:hypothetical protein
MAACARCQGEVDSFDNVVPVCALAWLAGEHSDDERPVHAGCMTSWEEDAWRWAWLRRNPEEARDEFDFDFLEAELERVYGN